MDVFRMSVKDKIGEAFLRSLPMLPGHFQEEVKALMTPEALAIISGTLIIWAGSHVFGVGELVDCILLVAGSYFIGWGFVIGVEQLYLFITTIITAKTEAQLNKAAGHFSKAVIVLGISVVSAILLRKPIKQVIARGKIKIYPLPEVGSPPPHYIRPTTKYVKEIIGHTGSMGITDYWGNIQVRVFINQTLKEKNYVLFHELVHRFLTPKVAPFRKIRAQLAKAGYNRYALLRAIEEAMAEVITQFRTHGLKNAFVGVTFPVKKGYVTFSQLVAEGKVIGYITLGGIHYGVYLNEGIWRDDLKNDQ